MLTTSAVPRHPLPLLVFGGQSLWIALTSDFGAGVATEKEMVGVEVQSTLEREVSLEEVEVGALRHEDLLGF